MDNLILKILAIVFLLASVNAGAQINTLDSQQQINMDADHSELDLATSTAIFHNLRILQGTTRIEASRAETSAVTSFTDSEWQFRGDVEIDVGTTRIRADSATLTFLNHQLVNAKVGGSPAQFSDIDEANGQTTEGAAEKFDYDLASNTVRFENNASLRNADNEISGKLLLYNVTNRQVIFEGDAQSGERVRITVQPPAATDEATPDP